MLQAAVREDPLAAAPAGTGAGLAQAGAALRDGDVAAAVAALDGVKEAAPAWAEPTRLKAAALTAGGQLVEGVTAFREAIRLAPRDERAYVGLAETLVQEARYREADEVLGAGLKAVASSTRLHHLRGQSWQRQGRLPEALAEYELALRAHPRLPLLGLNSLYETIATLQRSQQAFPRSRRGFREASRSRAQRCRGPPRPRRRLLQAGPGRPGVDRAGDGRGAGPA